MYLHSISKIADIKRITYSATGTFFESPDAIGLNHPCEG